MIKREIRDEIERKGLEQRLLGVIPSDADLSWRDCYKLIRVDGETTEFINDDVRRFRDPQRHRKPAALPHISQLMGHLCQRTVGEFEYLSCLDHFGCLEREVFSQFCKLLDGVRG